MAITCNLAAFQKAVQQKLIVGRKTAVYELNHSVLKIALGSGSGFGLVHYTRKATVERIKSDLQRPVTGRPGRGDGKRRRRIQSKPLVFWLALGKMKRMGMPNTKENVKAMITAITKARVKSRAYIAAGWFHAAADLAQHVPGHKLTRMKKSDMPVVMDKSAAESFATPAIENGSGRYSCSLYNLSRGAPVVVTSETMQRAINDAVHDIQIYIIAKMAKEMKKPLLEATKTARAAGWSP